MTWPRLSVELTGPKHPERCQGCSVGPPGLARWREHDQDDRPEFTVVVLCKACSDRLIDEHPRLYGLLQRHEPQAGCMPICVDCAHRKGVSCSSPDAKANGGPGVVLTVPAPIVVHVRRARPHPSGFQRQWSGPVRICMQREEVESPEGKESA